MTSIRARLFLAGVAVPAPLLALGAAASFLFPQIGFMTQVWCFVPLLWGLWAALAPSHFIPRHLPWWGAVLGAIAAIFGAVIMNFPARVLGQAMPLSVRWLAVVLAPPIYYFVWMLVRALYLRLTPSPAAMPRTAG